MTRPFSVPTVLRMVPNALLQEFFRNHGHTDVDPLWAGLKEKDIEPILAYLDQLPRDQVDALESGLRSVSAMASEGGLTALQEAGNACGIRDLGSLVPEHLSVWGRGMWLWLNHRAIFDKAQILYQIEQMSWWRKRNDLPQNVPDTSQEAIAELTQEISKLLRTQGRGKSCTVECMQRGDVHYFFAYPDDFVENVLVHDTDGKLSPETFRQTLLVVFAYNEVDGSLELFAKGLHKPIKERLESIFADVIMHWELDAFDPEAAYELDHLKDRFLPLRTDPADQLHVRIRRLRLSSRYTSRRILLEIDGNDPDEDIHQAIADCLNLEQVPLSEWHVTQVSFCFEFLPLDGRKHGRQSFDISYPRSCSLRNARPERVELIQRYLKQWGIDLAASVESSFLTLGG